jgi:hypothetical protein
VVTGHVFYTEDFRHGRPLVSRFGMNGIHDNGLYSKMQLLFLRGYARSVD